MKKRMLFLYYFSFYLINLFFLNNFNVHELYTKNQFNKLYVARQKAACKRIFLLRRQLLRY